MSTDFTHNPQLLGISEELHSLILSKLSNVSDLNALSRTHPRFQNLLLDRMRALQRAALLTYGAAALRNRPRATYGDVFNPLQTMLTDEPFSEDATLVVARTFSGARVDKSVTVEDLYPEGWSSIESFCRVRDWWTEMCANHLAVALTTDVLSFLLFSAEAFLSQSPENFQLESHARTFTIELSSEQSADKPFVTKRLITAQLFRQLYMCSFNTRDGNVIFTCRKSNPESTFNVSCDALPTDLTVKTWARSFLGKIAPAQNIPSLHHAELRTPGQLQHLHLSTQKTFVRGGVKRSDRSIIF